MQKILLSFSDLATMVERLPKHDIPVGGVLWLSVPPKLKRPPIEPTIFPDSTSEGLSVVEFRFDYKAEKWTLSPQNGLILTF